MRTIRYKGWAGTAVIVAVLSYLFIVFVNFLDPQMELWRKALLSILLAVFTLNMLDNLVKLSRND